MSHPKVSIIIPVYNGANFMREAIDSALAQDYANIEVIVVNDGSTDATDVIAKSYGDRIRYFVKENGGVSTALNLAIENAQGEYISWLSHDDVYYPNKISRQIEELAKLENKNTILYSNWVKIKANSWRQREIKLQKKRDRHKLAYPLYPLVNGLINGCTLLIPKVCFDEVGLFDVALRATQDYELWYKMFPRFGVHFIPEALVKLRTHAAQCTNTLPQVQTEGDKLWIMMIEYLSEQDMVLFEGSVLNFYRRMEKFTRRAGYLDAESFVKEKLKGIGGSREVSLFSSFYSFFMRKRER